MTTDYYRPHAEALKPFFGMQSRIDSREKAFSFILGVLIGALLHCRSHQNASAESRIFPLSQLLSMTGDDLRGLYHKVMHELGSAPRKTRDKVEAVAVEARHLYASLSRLIELNEPTTTYFILYGISVSASIFKHPRPHLVI